MKRDYKIYGIDKTYLKLNDRAFAEYSFEEFIIREYLWGSDLYYDIIEKRDGYQVNDYPMTASDVNNFFEYPNVLDDNDNPSFC